MAKIHHCDKDLNFNQFQILLPSTRETGQERHTAESSFLIIFEPDFKQRKLHIK